MDECDILVSVDTTKCILQKQSEGWNKKHLKARLSCWKRLWTMVCRFSCNKVAFTDETKIELHSNKWECFWSSTDEQNNIQGKQWNLGERIWCFEDIYKMMVQESCWRINFWHESTTTAPSDLATQ